MAEKVTLEYNPYLKKTILKINGESLKKESKLYQLEKDYLQNWLEADVSKNWKGLPQELAKEINDDFELFFTGREIDYDDVRGAFELAELGNVDCKLLTPYIIKADEVSMQRMDAIVAQMKRGPFEELKKPQLYQHYEKAKKAVFEVNIMATMSSGKSTVLNAMLGRELLPSKNEACTATIARITADATLSSFEAECKDEEENVVYARKSVQDKDLDNYNEDAEVYYIDLYGPIPTLQSNKMQLQLVDTPGPNNSRAEEHGEITRRVIQNMTSSMVIYILNATQLGINDDNALLKSIAEELQKQDRLAQDRILFVLNKCDDLDPEDEEDVSGVIERVRGNLKDMYGIEKARIIPVTAYMARLIRQIQCGESLTRKERRELEGYIDDCIEMPIMFFEQYADISPSCKYRLKSQLEQAETDEEKVLIHTGIPALESAIKEYLDKYAYPMMLEDVYRGFNNKVRGILQEKNIEKKLQEKKISVENLQNVANQLESIISDGKRKKEIEKNISNVTLSLDGFINIRNGLEKIEDELIRSYMGKDGVEYAEAERLLEQFEEKATKKINELFGHMQAVSVRTIEDGSKKIYSIYNNYIEQLNLDLKLGESEKTYDLSDALRMKGIDFSNSQIALDDYISQKDMLETRTREEEEEYEVDNPQKRWWTFWRPKKIKRTRKIQIEYQEKVGEKTIVNLSEFVRAAMDEYRSGYQRSFREQKENLINEFENIKNNILKEQMKKVDQELQNIANKFRDICNQEEMTQQEIQKLEQDLAWLKNVKERLDSVFSF